MKPGRPAESGLRVRKSGRPVSSKGLAGGRCGTCNNAFRRITDIFFPKTGLSVRLKILSIGSLLRDETRYLLNYLVKSGNAAKRGGPRRKIWKASKGVWKACNPLKSHKTAKDLFGKAWSKTREFWRSLKKGLVGAFIPPPLAPAASGLRSAPSLRGASDEVTCQPAALAFVRASAGLKVYTEKRMARFIQGDRPEDRCGTRNDGYRPYLENFLYFSRCGTTLSIPSRRFLSSS